MESEISIRELRVVVLFGGKMRSLCKLVFTKTDASLYLVPYAPSDRYSVGTQRMGEDEHSITFDIERAQNYEAAPKISFHQSGQVHANAGAARVGPLTVPRLPDWRGQHLATVLADHAGSLPDFQSKRRWHGQQRDLVLELRGQVESAKVVLYANGIEPRFDGPCPFRFKLAHTTLPRPMYVGLLPQGQIPFSYAGMPGTGVVAIGGWVPDRSSGAAVDFLYVRGT